MSSIRLKKIQSQKTAGHGVRGASAGTQLSPATCLLGKGRGVERRTWFLQDIWLHFRPLTDSYLFSNDNCNEVGLLFIQPSSYFPTLCNTSQTSFFFIAVTLFSAFTLEPLTFLASLQFHLFFYISYVTTVIFTPFKTRRPTISQAQGLNCQTSLRNESSSKLIT